LSKGDLIEIEGVVQEALGGGQYSVKVAKEAGSTEQDVFVRAQLSGKLRKHHIRVIPGDIITVGVSPYDMTHGIITYRGRKR